MAPRTLWGCRGVAISLGSPEDIALAVAFHERLDARLKVPPGRDWIDPRKLVEVYPRTPSELGRKVDVTL